MAKRARAKPKAGKREAKKPQPRDPAADLALLTVSIAALAPIVQAMREASAAAAQRNYRAVSDAASADAAALATLAAAASSLLTR